VLAICGFVAFIAVDDATTRQSIVGLTSNCILVAYYASPLSTFRHVVRTRSAASLYPPMCVANTINGAAWALYGFVLDDWYLLVPNAVGCALGVVSLVLLVLYDRGKELKKSASVVEMLPHDGCPASPVL
jgi:solute carrier family 50 protein (sugar transporter)